MEAQPAAGGYPGQFDVAYPDRDLNRLTTFFRILWVMPILIVLGGQPRRRLRGSGWWRQRHLLRNSADDRLPPEVPPLVVRLEPRDQPIHKPDRRLPLPHGRHLSVDRRAAVGAARLPLPGRQARSEPLAATREMVKTGREPA